MDVTELCLQYCQALLQSLGEGDGNEGEDRGRDGITPASAAASGWETGRSKTSTGRNAGSTGTGGVDFRERVSVVSAGGGGGTPSGGRLSGEKERERTTGSSHTPMGGWRAPRGSSREDLSLPTAADAEGVGRESRGSTHHRHDALDSFSSGAGARIGAGGAAAAAEEDDMETF
uniref:Uncharacterized protein n=1 Tax=Chromera velia CCMP2878 TaxID=1169474 RepID=A0A0G4H8K4_9ALVE|eukprot:Cvel_5904.t1-p1 / transcript=Cvel_5904.t1 / gene=Cvel_5904 / organism=Chromera_velia_CCMP2878 / gene_product=hypothetical protein / transcript_product=hypothetical protein / location=Cvel_scaffold281:106534-107052(-) / protein_length=173 / sequence_SO=supercontig / SO=protein_coding / is_pseudo=false